MSRSSCCGSTRGAGTGYFNNSLMSLLINVNAECPINGLLQPISGAKRTFLKTPAQAKGLQNASAPSMPARSAVRIAAVVADCARVRRLGRRRISGAARDTDEGSLHKSDG